MNEWRGGTDLPDTHQSTQVVVEEGWAENVRKQSYHVTSPPHPSTRPFPFKVDPQTGQKEIQWIFLFPRVCVCTRCKLCCARACIVVFDAHPQTMCSHTLSVCMVEILEPDFVLGKGILWCCMQKLNGLRVFDGCTGLEQHFFFKNVRSSADKAENR